MPPSLSMVHVDKALTNISIQYRNLQFVADDVFPVFPVGNRSDKYFKFDLTRFRQLDDTRGIGTEANEVGGWDLSTDLYSCDGHALRDLIPDAIRGNADPATDIDVTTTETLTDLVLLNREINLVSVLFGAGSLVPNVTLAGSSQWSDYTSNPIVAVEAQKATILKATGKLPNRLLLSYPVFAQLRNHPAVYDRLKYVEKANPLTPEQLAAAFDVEKVTVAMALKQTTAEGEADNLDFIWGKNALLYYRPPSIGLKTVALGAHFTWTYGMPANNGYRVKRYREEKRDSDVVEVELWYDQHVIAAAAGYAFLDAVA